VLLPANIETLRSFSSRVWASQRMPRSPTEMLSLGLSRAPLMVRLLARMPVPMVMALSGLDRLLIRQSPTMVRVAELLVRVTSGL